MDDTSEFNELNSGNINQSIPVLDDDNSQTLTIEQHQQTDVFNNEYGIKNFSLDNQEQF